MTADGSPRPASEVADGLAVNLVGSGLVVAVGVVVAIAAGVLLALGAVGQPQALGAVLGAGLVTGCSLFGSVTVSLVAAYVPRASLLVALLTYTLQVGVLALALSRVQGSLALQAEVDVRWVGGAVVLTTVAWLALLVVRAVRTVPGRSLPGPSGPGRSGATSRGGPDG